MQNNLAFGSRSEIDTSSQQTMLIIVCLYIFLNFLTFETQNPILRNLVSPPSSTLVSNKLDFFYKKYSNGRITIIDHRHIRHLGKSKEEHFSIQHSHLSLSHMYFDKICFGRVYTVCT